MAFKPSLRRRKPPEDVALNTTPIMNLMVVLIPLLLAGAKFTEFSLLEYLPPAEAAGGTEASATPSEGGGPSGQERLNLIANFTEQSIQLSIYGNLDPESPYFYEIEKLPMGSYNWQAFQDSLVSIKNNIVGAPIGRRMVFNERTGEEGEVDTYKYEDASEISIVATNHTTFQTIVNAMDYSQRYRDERTVNGQLVVEERALFPNPILKQIQ